MLISKFDYQLPEDLIAQAPLKERARSRMLVLNRRSGYCDIKRFTNFPSYIQPGDCVVINDTKVIPARLYGSKIPSGAKVEMLLVEQVAGGIWQAILKPARRVRVGTKIRLNGSQAGTFRIKNRIDDRVFEVEFSTSNVLELLNSYGQMPLPPYIRRGATQSDTERYQTVYATHAGAIAAPTAGLHFDHTIIQQLKNKNIHIVPITLHINLGTFQPIAVEEVGDHQMHAEQYVISEDSARLINMTKQSGGAVVAVGTSVVRALESRSGGDGKVKPGRGTTDLFLHPPRKPKTVDKLLTNFHLPKSTLLMLVCIFATRKTVLQAYNLAVRERFRFYSYGDCMLLV